MVFIPQSLGADSLYGGKAGTAVVSHRGYVIYDLRSVKSALLERWHFCCMLYHMSSSNTHVMNMDVSIQ